jgi:hypothetical protein
MKLLAITLITLSSFLKTTADINLLPGKWKYSDIYEKEKLDEKSMKMLTMFFSDMKIEFKKDQTYSATMMGKDETGTWKNDGKNPNLIELKNQKGQENKIEVIELTNEKLVFGLGNGKFIMVKE